MLAILVVIWLLQQLYQWMIAPLESDLKALGIDTQFFCMDGGLRQIPLAVLHDGKQFW
jgi:CHAT domain-containing protein